MADKLIIDWKEYNLTVEKLAIQIYHSGFKPDMLIGIMRGGAPIIDVLSRIFKLKCAFYAGFKRFFNGFCAPSVLRH